MTLDEAKSRYLDEFKRRLRVIYRQSVAGMEAPDSVAHSFEGFMEAAMVAGLADKEGGTGSAPRLLV